MQQCRQVARDVLGLGRGRQAVVSFGRLPLYASSPQEYLGDRMGYYSASSSRQRSGAHLCARHVGRRSGRSREPGAGSARPG